MCTPAYEARRAQEVRAAQGLGAVTDAAHAFLDKRDSIEDSATSCWRTSTWQVPRSCSKSLPLSWPSRLQNLRNE